MNKASYDGENSVLINAFLNRTHFAGWRVNNIDNPMYMNYRSLELQVNANCNQSCEYCYYDVHKEELYPSEISNPNTIIANLDLLLNWLVDNQLLPKFELFSGELLVQDIGIKVLEKVIDWHITNKFKGSISIPTNFSWVDDTARINHIQNLIDVCEANGINIALSCSMDGKYADTFRPVKGMARSDEFYDKVFEFCAKNSCGFHPMIYSKAVSKWEKNFIWFQDMFRTYEIPWSNLYLLVVRKSNWSDTNVKDFYLFIRFLVKWIYNIIQAMNSHTLTNEEVTTFIFKSKLMNLFGPFATFGRGVGCSVQSAVQLRLGDLAGTLCHRQSYSQLIPWKFNVVNGKLDGVKAFNIAPYIAQQTTVITNQPICQSCQIKHLCLGGCFGAQFETMGDMFAPIPSVCSMLHAKVAALIDGIKEVGLLESFYNIITKEKRDTIDIYLKQQIGGV